MKPLIYLVILYIIFCSNVNFAQDKNLPPEILHINHIPDQRPSRIILTWEADPSTTASVTWRTDTSINNAKAEITLADPSPYFNDYEYDVEALTTVVINEYVSAKYHKVKFENLQPGTQYLYRVGNDKYWSEWFQFKTANTTNNKFHFIYMGDAQNKIFSHWSRVIRAAYSHGSEASFILHAGDLINHAENDYEWGEWFEAGNFIHATMPTLALPGNHEYNKNESGLKVSLSQLWQPQFNYFNNAPIDTLQDQAYYFDYQHMRMIVLNSNQFWEDQAIWLDRILTESKQKWNILAFHHPIRNAVEGRQNHEVVKYWQPIIEKHKVDLVLQGHDHTYARGYLDPKQNGPLYLVSIAGEKMYELTEQEWINRKGENTQLFQIIELEGATLNYKSLTPEGKVYDAFQLEKRKNRPNKFIELKNDFPEERRNANTLKEK